MKLHGLSEEETAKLLHPRTVLLGWRGSIAHGTFIPQDQKAGIDDKDIMGVFIPEIDHYVGLKTQEHLEVQYREYDAVSYEFRKFARLLLKSNPNVIALLWLKEGGYIMKTEAGERLLAARELFSTKRIYHSFTGYAYAQLHKMTHFAFNGYMGEKRKQLVVEFGYDTKNAAHLIRLLRMGIEFLNEGELHVWREDAPQLLEIKRGEWSLDQVHGEADKLFKRAEGAYDRCKLPTHPDEAKVNRLVTSIIWDTLKYRPQPKEPEPAAKGSVGCPHRISACGDCIEGGFGVAICKGRGGPPPRNV